jgi:probable rRNA maturation factor
MTRRVQGGLNANSRIRTSSPGSLPPCGGGTGREVAADSVLPATPLPNPPPSQVGPARLAHDEAQPGQARVAGVREQAEQGERLPQATGPAVDVVAESSLWEAHAGTEAAVRRAVAAAAPAGLGDAEVAVLLADDARVRDMNAHWRGKNTATNVLSFPAAPSPGPSPRHLGDIVLAYETVAEEARAQDTPFETHLIHLVVHGFLHLIGYDHMTDDEAEDMEQRERDTLAGLGIADPYAARDADT